MLSYGFMLAHDCPCLRLYVFSFENKVKQANKHTLTHTHSYTEY